MKPLRLLIIVAALAAVATTPVLAAGQRPSVELRLTPPFERPYRAPTLGALAALPLSDHLWVGAGYELVQDYDAILWTAKDTGHRPVVMSGIHAGFWYRGGAFRQGPTWAAGGLVTFSDSAFSLARSPPDITAATYVVDLGADLSVGKVWDGIRIELFATPAWSVGRIVSTGIDKTEHLSKLTYRVGLAVAVLLGA